MQHPQDNFRQLLNVNIKKGKGEGESEDDLTGPRFSSFAKTKQEFKDTINVKDFYHFTFIFAKNPGQKGWNLEILKLSYTWKGYIFRYWNKFLLDPYTRSIPRES